MNTVSHSTTWLVASAVPADLLDAISALRKLPAEQVVFVVLVQLAVIIVVARLFFVLFRRLRQPGVTGEIAAGIVLGPSVLKKLWPAAFGMVFQPQVVAPGLPPELFDATFHWIMSVLSQIGLVLLLFLIGLEFDFRHLRDNRKGAFGISLAGIVLPFLLGLGVAMAIFGIVYPRESGDGSGRYLGFALFMGTAMSITALPILGRMMLEMNISRTRLGTITISAAATDDAAGWIMLATVSAIVVGDFQLVRTLVMIVATVSFVLAMLFVVRPLVTRWARWSLAQNRGQLGLTSLAILLVLIFASALATNLIGIFSIFGAFALGATLSSEDEFREAVSRSLRDFVTVFFLPIFFTYTGLRTNIGTLENGTLWLVCGLVLAAAVIGKLAGCGIAARLLGFSSREAVCIGAMMNTRALMGLIAINIGYDLGVIPDSVFCMLVIMALVTTLMGTPLLTRFARGTELEPHLRATGFLPPAP